MVRAGSQEGYRKIGYMECDGGGAELSFGCLINYWAIVDSTAASAAIVEGPGAGFNGRVNGFTRVDFARPVADQ